MKRTKIISGVLALSLVFSSMAMQVSASDEVLDGERKVTAENAYANDDSSVADLDSSSQADSSSTTDSSEPDNSEEPYENGSATVPSGYTTDANGIMAYMYGANMFDNYFNYDLKGYFGGLWRSTTYGDRGFYTFYKNSSGTIELVEANKSAVNISANPGVTLKTTISPAGYGKYLKVTYTLENTTASAVSYSLGGYADVQIGEDDEAAVVDIKGEDGSFQGYMMASEESYDMNTNGEYAQFNIFLSNVPGITKVDTCNISEYPYDLNYTKEELLAERSKVAFAADGTTAEPGTFDSVIGFAWQDRTIAANSTQSYSVLYGVGGFNSDVVALATNTDIAIPEGSTLKLESGKVSDYFETEVESTVIDVLTFENATYQVFADETCTVLLEDNVMPLVKGLNYAYILVTAEDGVTTRVYPVTIQNGKVEESSSESSSSTSSKVKDGNPKTGSLPLALAAIALTGAAAVTIKRKK